MHKLIPYLKQNDLTINTLAELCNVTKRTIYNWNKTGIVKDPEKIMLLKELVPEFEPTTIELYETNLRPPNIEIERDSDLPKIKIVYKSSHDK